MPNDKISKITLPDGTTYDIQDTTYSAGTGLSLSDTIINHSNSVTAQTTQAIYPITIDAQGHIGSYGNAASIPTKTSDLTNDSGFITGMTILSYGSSTWANFIAAYNANKVVYCRASSNANPASGSQTRLAFMAYVNNATTPTEVEFQYYRSVSTHTESQQGDQVYVYKLNKNNGWSVTAREASVKVAYNNGITGTYSNGVMTLKHANTAITAQATQGLYPIKIDAYGHITGYGSEVTSLPASDVSSWAKASTKPSYALSEITGAEDVQAIEGLTGTSGLLKKTAANTWTLDTTAYTTNTGTVTKVIAGTGLAVGSTAQGNFTTSGTINHTNSITAQTTQAVYPIKIDAQGHISAYGSAVTIPQIATNTPLMDLGNGSIGSSSKYAKEDHVHPTDTSRAAAGLGISSASVGQVVKISSVDSSGVPTAYTSGTASSGMVITLTLSGSTYTADKTYDEINTALSSGINCCVVYNSMQYPFISRRNSSSSFYFDFCKIDASQYGVSKDGFTIYKDGNNTRVQSYYSHASIPSIPDPIAPSTILELVQNDDDPPNWVINGSPIEDMELCFYGEGTWTPITVLRKHVVDFEGNYPPINGNTENYYLSKLYTTYEPTIIGGYEEYIITGYLVFQAIVNDNGIKKIKTITVSEEFYQQDYLANATITFSEEIVNITYYCSATLSSPGWYRLMKYSAANASDVIGLSAFVIDFSLLRRYANNLNETHKISLFANYNSIEFLDEVSKSLSRGIDKIRYIYNGTDGYVDIHYSLVDSNFVSCDFMVHAPMYQDKFTVESLQSVADAPSGETVMTTHTFVPNTCASGSIAGSYGTIYYNKKYDVCSIYGDVNNVPTGAWTTLATGLPAPVMTQFFIAQNGSSNDFVMCQLNTSGTLKFYGRGSYSSGYPTWTYVCN